MGWPHRGGQSIFKCIRLDSRAKIQILLKFDLFVDVLARSVSGVHTLLESIAVWGTQIEGRFEVNVTNFAVSNRLSYFYDSKSNYNSSRLSYPHNCLILDLNNALTPEQFEHADMIHFVFKFDEGSSMEIAIEDRLSALERDNPEAKRRFLGPMIEQKLNQK